MKHTYRESNYYDIKCISYLNKLVKYLMTGKSQAL